MGFLILASVFAKAGPTCKKNVDGIVVFSLLAAIFLGLRCKKVECICDFAFSRSGVFVVPIVVEAITMLFIMLVVLLAGCAKVMGLKSFKKH